MPGRTVRFVEIATNSLTDVTVPKNRKPRFEILLRIIDLNNVPLVSGSAFVKWHLTISPSAEHRGRTAKAPIKSHKVTWDHNAQFSVRFVMDRTGMLQDQEISFEIVQEYSSGARADRITLGSLRLNLAEYVEEAEGDIDDPSSGAVRRYLMQESKINSTLRLGFVMKQIDGDRNFVCPPLKTAAVFGGIAGVMNSSDTMDPNGSDELLPASMSSQKAKDHSELQDVYRKSLAASWSSYMRELPADQCIEDLFSGGDGWGDQADGSSLGKSSFITRDRMRTKPHARFASGQSDIGSGRFLSHQRQGSRDSQSQGVSQNASSMRNGNLDMGHGSSSDESKNQANHLREISEFEVLDDLSSWSVGGGSKDQPSSGGLHV